MTAAVKEKTELSLFVRREIDNYGLDPYEIRLYTPITRRSSRGEAWENITSWACVCCMSLSRTRLALQILNLAEITQ
jgi:hypothetical protein